MRWLFVRLLGTCRKLCTNRLIMFYTRCFRLIQLRPLLRLHARFVDYVFFGHFRGVLSGIRIRLAFYSLVLFAFLEFPPQYFLTLGDCGDLLLYPGDLQRSHKNLNVTLIWRRLGHLFLDNLYFLFWILVLHFYVKDIAVVWLPPAPSSFLIAVLVPQVPFFLEHLNFVKLILSLRVFVSVHINHHVLVCFVLFHRLWVVHRLSHALLYIALPSLRLNLAPLKLLLLPFEQVIPESVTVVLILNFVKDFIQGLLHVLVIRERELF